MPNKFPFHSGKERYVVAVDAVVLTFLAFSYEI